MNGFLQTIGCCEKRLFGISPGERLARQRGSAPGPLLIADASIVLSDPAVAWLLENPGKVLTTPAGRRAAVAVDQADEALGRSAIRGEGSLPSFNPAMMPDVFIRRLRRRDKLLVRSLEEGSPFSIEQELFANVYKGVTDVVTKYVWPFPAFWVTKLCAALSIRPNLVTIVGMISMAAAAYLWAEGELVAGLLLAWLMTFLDTVDGKLARVTATSSVVGNLLDHVTDMVHPPIWWICLAIGIAEHEPAAAQELTLFCILILAAYVVGRLIETLFKVTIGYNAYLWRPFDSRFRLIVARRNTILLIMTLGIFAGAPVEAYAVSAIWSLVSAAIQLLRYLQAWQAHRKGDARSWLM